MFRGKQRLLIETALLGVGFTLFVVLADQTGWLSSLENWCYDQRAARCQWFTPPPTTKLIHLDIDDRALDVIPAKYPWPRAIFAEMLEELATADPKAVAFDLIIADAEKVLDGNGQFVPSGGDARYSAALARMKGGILAVDVSLDDASKATAAVRAIHHELTNDLNIELPELTRRLMAGGIRGSDVTAAIDQDRFLSYRRQAAFDRISAMFDSNTAPSLDEVRRKLMPAARADFNVNSPVSNVIKDEYEKVLATRAAARLAPAKPKDAAPITSLAALNLVPLEQFSAAVARNGFVSYSLLPGGVARSMPLAVEAGGKVYPQLGLALACSMLDVDLARIRFNEASMVLPQPDGNDITIPTHSQFSSNLGRTVYEIIDIPWFGGHQWQYMYDFPKYATTVQHLSMTALWAICETRRQIIENNRNADAAISFILDSDEHKVKIAMDPPRAKAYFSHLPPPEDAPGRREVITFTIAQLKDSGFIEQYQSMKDADFDEGTRLQWRSLQKSRDSLETAAHENDKLVTQLQQQRVALRAQLGGKAVLIGWTGTSVAADFVPTSLHTKCPGVIVHGAIFNAVMSRYFWHRVPRWVTIAYTLFLGVAAAFAASVLRPARAAVIATLMVVGYIAFNGIFLFDYGGAIVGMSAPVVAVAVVWTGCTLVRVIAEGKQRALITRRFSNYADPMLVDYLVEHPEQARFEGQVRELTVVFTDLQGFTSISEQLGEKSVTLLNKYLGIMVPIIRRNKGYVNKFLGDGIMFFFGAPYENPDHAKAALRTVLEMQEAMSGFNVELAKAGLTQLIMRAGVSTGHMVVGDAGSIDPERSDYTVLGDCVNLGARLESGNKSVGTRLLANGRAKQVGGAGVLMRPIGSFCYLGKTEGTATFEILAYLENATPEQHAYADASADMVTAFASARFDQCILAAAKIEASFGVSKLTTLYRELCQRYLSEGVPLGFAGNIILSAK